MKKFVFAFLLIFIYCSIYDDENYVYDEWASVDKIEINSNNNGELKFTIDLAIPTPCNEFHRRDIQQSGNTLNIQYFSK